MSWCEILPQVWRYRDSCNVYAVCGDRGVVLVDAGTGAWLDELSALPSPPVAVICTHYFRDHSAGAIRAARSGIPVYVPEIESDIFADPVGHFQRRSAYITYENLWDFYAPIEPVNGARSFLDYATLKLAGMTFESVPLPGVTLGQSGVAVRLDDGRKVVFCAEAIHSPGRMARLAPLQYNYNGLPGAINAYQSAARLRTHSADGLFPSLGEPILAEVDAALVALQETLRAVTANRPFEAATIRDAQRPTLTQVTDHVWKSTHSWAHTYFLLSDSGKAMAIDYGYELPFVLSAQCVARRERRRALLHGLDALRTQFGIDRLDMVLVSHFHDDHVCGIPLLQRKFGTECWVPENFADLLAEPAAHCFPCNWPDPARIDRRLPMNEPAQWEEYTFHFAEMSGHTRFSALIGFEADGIRMAHTGDQYFFQKGGTGDTPVEPYSQNIVAQNYVYRNGALLNGYEQSERWLREWRPEIILQGHQRHFEIDESFYERIGAWTGEYRELHRASMALGEEETHFDLDSWGGWIWPYRTHLDAPQPITLKVTVRNPLPRDADLKVVLVGPAGWRGSAAAIRVSARGEGSCELVITPVGACRNQPIAVELSADGQRFGQVAEALVTVNRD